MTTKILTWTIKAMGFPFAEMGGADFKDGGKSGVWFQTHEVGSADEPAKWRSGKGCSKYRLSGEVWARDKNLEVVSSKDRLDCQSPRST